MTNPFNFKITMPTGGISIYAKWEKPVFEDTVHLSLNGGNDTISIDVPYGQKLNPSDMPTVVDASGITVFEGGQQHIINLPKDTKWIGWCTKNGSDYRVWNMNQEVYQNIELYPYYISTESFHVTYDLNGGDGVVPQDNNNYAQGSYAKVLSAIGIRAPDGKVFLDWKAGDGNHYAPGDWIAINGDVELTAQYGDVLKNTEVRYHLNLGDDKSKRMQLDNNGIVAAIALPSEWETAGKRFVGWNTSKDGTGTAVNPGQNIMVYNDGNQQPIANDLYAQWKTELKISITGAENTVPYNGKKQELTGFTCKYEIGGQNVEKPAGTSVTWSKDAKTASGKDYGEYTVQLSGADFTFSDTEHYEVTFEIKKDIILHIRKARVKLTSGSDEKEYDGKPLTNTKDPVVSGEGFAPGEGATYSFTGSQTDVGESDNTFNYSLNENTKKDNYDITSVYGKLKITQSTKEIIVEIEGDQKEHLYDGKPHEASGYSVTKITQPESINYKYSDRDFTCTKLNLKVTGTDASTYKLGLAATDFQNSNNNFSKVTFKINKDAVLVINPRQVTLTSESASKAYDGTALTRPDVKIEGDGFVDGEVSGIKAAGTITTVDTIKNTITYEPGKKFKETNYVITKKEGTLEIFQNEKAIVVTAKNAEKKYDGKPLTDDRAEVTGLPKDHTAEVTVSGTITDAGKVDNTVKKVVIKNAEGQDVTNQFKTITKNKGTLTISKRNVKLTSEGGNKPYDGTALTKPTVTVGGDGFVDGEVKDLKATGTVTSVSDGEVENKIVYTPTGKFKADNYSIEMNPGKLSITAADLSDEKVFTVSQPADVVYNGLDQKQPVTVTRITPKATNAVAKLFSSLAAIVNVNADEALKVGTDYTLTYSKNLKDVGTVTVTVKGLGNYSGEVTRKYQITPAPLKVTTSSAEKVYDGKALTATGKLEGIVDADKTLVTLTVKGSQTEVGSSVNDYEINWGNVRKENYSLTESLGTLKVTARPEPSKPKPAASNPASAPASTRFIPRTAANPAEGK